MKLFGGLSLGGPGRMRAGVSMRGRPWAGGRWSAGPLYAGILTSGKRSGSRRRSKTVRVSGSQVRFEVFRGGIVTIDGRVVDREDLRRVLAVADVEAAKTMREE